MRAQGQEGWHRGYRVAYGVMLVVTLNGDGPFKGEDALSVSLKDVMSPVTSPRERVPDLPLHVERAIMRCMAKKPEDRYDDVTQLLTDLLRISTSMTPFAAATITTPGGKAAPKAAVDRNEELHHPTPTAARDTNV